MISFYPGPSQTHEKLPSYLNEAAKTGILSANHRSKEFTQLSKNTITLLKQKLSIPKNYTILFTSSATECWEIIAQSLILEKSYHFFNGAFGKKWFEYTLALKSKAEPIVFQAEETLNPSNYQQLSKQAVLCITQNETSNGTQVNQLTLKKFRELHPQSIIAIDATSSMAGVKLDFRLGDVWFASVQKCFGLPAGLAVMICSPKARMRAEQVNENSHYNSLNYLTRMIEKWQTTYTPNVLAIYLLKRVMENSKPIAQVHNQTLKQYTFINQVMHSTSARFLISNEKVRSYTVIALSAKPKKISDLKSKARKTGMILGEGYGELRSKTIRIANFPAISSSAYKKLGLFLKANFPK